MHEATATPSTTIPPVVTTDTSPFGDRRRQRGQRTREALEEAALRLVGNRGFESTTIEEIACEAGVSSRTFFRHFETKEDVLLGNQSEHLAHVRSLLDARPLDEPLLISVREAILGLAVDDERHREIRLARARITQASPTVQARSTERRAEWQDLIAAFVGDRLGVDRHTDLRPGLVAGATIAALQVAHRQWVESDARLSLTDLVRQALELLDNGFGLVGRPTTA